MPYQTGITQAGLPSEQQPSIPTVSLGPIGTTGLSVVGSPAADGIKTFGFAVNGRVMQHTITSYLCMVKLSLNKYVKFMITASVYSPNMTVRIQLLGSIVSGETNIYIAKGLLGIPVTYVMNIIGSITKQKTVRLKIIGVLQSTHDIVYRVQGAIEAYLKTTLYMTGLIRSIYMNKFITWGRIKGNYAKLLSLSGTIGLKNVNSYKVSSLLKIASSFTYKACSNMQTAVETRFFKIMGILSVPSFITAVPKRVQEFVTNKTWWR